MELDLLPGGKILFIERRGNLKVFDPGTGLTTIAYKLDVWSENEDGLMGLTVDPHYPENRWIYLYYSPAGKHAVNRLSRFRFAADTLDPASERMILEVAVQRAECCHTGGSIEFDDRGNLYLSTGDNTNPFESSGYAPIDERPGRSAWDAQKSSANALDLRGKILRIRPLPDGSYVCPAGNLFNDSDLHFNNFAERNARLATPGSGAPEVYVMGCRNPFRISVDSRRNLLFWGEVGPDAGEPDSARGPQGFDEINRARSAGFFGWPYFIGDNKPYFDYNFAVKKSGALFDAAAIENNSPNNYGAGKMTAPQPALIWYPYGNSPDFPLTGNGGRTAMAGPVYYCDQYPEKTRFPDYFDGKLLIYEWMRNWMMLVTLDSLGNFSRMEPVFDSLKLSRPMDMLIDPNGAVWVLEYGEQWFAQNPDARLSRIDYVRGNRPPVAVLSSGKTAAAAPGAIAFSILGTRDYDGDRFNSSIDFNDDSRPWTSKRNKRFDPDSIFHTFTSPGKYEVTLTATDGKGGRSTARQTIQIGNEAPQVHWDFAGRNRSFYVPGDTLHYKVEVWDKEDGALATGSILPQSVAISADYLATGFDITQIALGHSRAKSAAEYARGKVLVERSDCKTCHAVERKINGPSYLDISARYRNSEFAVNDLSKKVLKGGSGVWGETVMSAHPQLGEEEVHEMIRWILSLGGPPKAAKTLPPEGAYALTLPPADKKGPKTHPGVFIFQAAYRDRGTASGPSQESSETIALRPAFQQAELLDSLSKGVLTYQPGKDTVYIRDLKHGSFFAVKHVDLNGLHSAAVGIGSGDARYKFQGGELRLHLDRPDGPLLGSVKVAVDNSKKRMTTREVTLSIRRGHADGRFHDLYFVVHSPGFASEPALAVDWVRFNL